MLHQRTNRLIKDMEVGLSQVQGVLEKVNVCVTTEQT